MDGCWVPSSSIATPWRWRATFSASSWCVRSRARSAGEGWSRSRPTAGPRTAPRTPFEAWRRGPGWCTDRPAGPTSTSFTACTTASTWWPGRRAFPRPCWYGRWSRVPMSGAAPAPASSAGPYRSIADW